VSGGERVSSAATREERLGLAIRSTDHELKTWL
jgi:hypothetical protein